MTAPTPAARVVADADLCLPPMLQQRLGILTAPVDAPRLLVRESIPRLAVESAGRLGTAPLVEVCREAARGGSDVIYVTAGDGYGHPDGGADAAREAVEAAGGTLSLIEGPDALMAAGWRAVVAAEALATGAAVPVAVKRAGAASCQVLALIEHPELTNIEGMGSLGTPSRVLAFIEGDAFRVDALPKRRDDGLRLLRDRFAAVTRPGDRVAILHGGVAPAAEAMEAWIRRNVDAAEVVTTSITRHAATRLGPGLVAIAWTAPDPTE